VAARRSPTVQRRRLGIELRRLREQAGLTIEKVAVALECSDSKVSRIETGQVSATPRDVRDVLELYKVDRDHREALIQFARQARQRGWWQAYSDTPVVPLVGLETAAESIQQYEARVVPGLLQTQSYAEAIIRALRPDLSPQQTNRWVELRMARQQLLRQADPPEIAVVLEEYVLRRPVGGREAMREQLLLLAQAATLPALTLQVLPLAIGQHAAISGSFAILGFAESDGPDVVYLEHARGDLYLDSTEQVRRYADAFERLRAVALTREDSVAFLATAAEEL
jgi:transcriptional regulator with XRE-family HTH domain